MDHTRRRNIVWFLLLFVGIAVTFVSIVLAAAPDPGHNFTSVSGGVVQGDLLYGSAADTLLALPKDGTATRYLSNTGTTNNPAWAQVNLANGVTGTLADGNVASALTGKTYNALTLTAQGTGFTIAGGTTSKTLTLTGDATISGTPLSNPMTTLGDVVYGGASGVATRLAGAAGFLKSTGAVAPAFSSINLASADVTGLLPDANIAAALTGKTYNALTLTAAATGFTIAGGTTSKTLTISNTLTFNGTDATVMTFPTTSKTIAANDGSNWTFASQAIGDLHYATSTTAYGRLADVAVGSYLQSGGVGAAPAWTAGRIFINRQVKAAGNATYVATAGTTAILIQMCGAGGGGAGGLGGASTAMVGGGGGAGGYLEKYITFTSLTASYAINIPAGGGGGSGAAAGSTPGTNTTFTCDATCSSNLVFTAFSGAGAAIPAATGTSVLPSNPGAGGAISTNGDVNTKGQPGGAGLRFSAASSISGPGGSSQFGGGGNQVITTTAGLPGGLCAGGSGADSLSASSQTGGAGGAGTIVIWEFR